MAAGDVVAFNWGDDWHQVPVQVDERKQVDLGTVYNSTATGFVTTVYADPDTFTGADANPNVDADDEIAFRARRRRARGAGRRRRRRRAPSRARA